MTGYTLASIILTLAVFIGYINHRFIKMPTTIAIMVGALVLSMVFIILNRFGLFPFTHELTALLQRLDFKNILLKGMLSFLLFAGALNVNLDDLRHHRWEVAILASLGTIASTFIVGFLTYWLLHVFAIQISLVYCLLFGALISPTDPIAVLATFKRLNAPKDLDVIVAGESLFNDGVGIVIFLTLLHLAVTGTPVTFADVSALFLQQAIGGIAYGIVLGFFCHWLIVPIDEHKIVILVTLAIVTGGYALAEALNISGPLAMVVAGIIIGSRKRKLTLSERSREYLDSFWELIDEILNAVLFLLIGLELLVIHIHSDALLVAIIAIPMVLFTRFITVATPMVFFKAKRRYPKHTIKILVWGGLRGGLAVALALSLPHDSPHRSLILSMTYAVVAFAIIIQGLSTKSLVAKASQCSPDK